MPHDHHQFEDSEAWKGLIKGDRKAFESIYKRYFRRLYSYGCKVSGDPVLVEDAVHDLFLDLWKYHKNLSFTTSISFYLFRALRRKIVKNNSRDLDSSVFDFNLADFQLSAMTIEDSMIASEDEDEQLRRLKRNLNHLSSRQYEALILRFYGNFSYTEIGEILEVNEQSARNLIQRALEQLRNFARIMPSVLSLLHILS